MATRYITGKEQAKMIRAALKAAFPTFKFDSITSKGSINIRWTNGPTKKEVESITNGFRGGYFDGSTDYAGSHTAKLASGEEVGFLCDYIFTERNYTDGFIDQTVIALSQMSPRQYTDVLNNRDVPRWDLRTDEDLNDHKKVAKCFVHVLSLCPPKPVEGLPVIVRSF